MSMQQTLRNTALFAQINETDLEKLLSCLEAVQKTYEKQEVVLQAGSAVTKIGIVLSGVLQIEKNSSEGERMLLASLQESDYFAETLCCAGVKESPVSVVAVQESRVLFLDYTRITQNCNQSCGFHTQLLLNMMQTIAAKNLHLQSRLDILSRKTLREKLFCCLGQYGAQRGRIVTVPFNREELADYLCVDRYALSHELSRLKKEGALDYHKNSFRLL